MSSSHSRLIEDFRDLLVTAGTLAPVLDLACGEGRNGIYLNQHGVPVVFADRSQTALGCVSDKLEQQPADPDGCANELWCVDFETAASEPLAQRNFGAIVVFRYLHRPLMRSIRDAILPGGVVVYETFTVGQAALGRPQNPDFLLQPKELAQTFADWDIVHLFEGVVDTPSGTQQAIAQLVAIKPG
ncbi:MAG: methyltransferase domain-containing protein [Halioglobus sp.]